VTISRPTRLAALALTAAFAAAACSGSGSSTTPTDGASAGPAVEGTVVVDGSSTVYPVTEAVAEEFRAVQPGVDVPVAESGTGGGFKKFCAGETDINDASRPIKETDEAEGVACETNGVTWVQLQVAIDGLTVVVNPENTWVTCLTLEQLAIIYGPDSPEDLSWKAVDPSFPDQPVVRYMPGADSGTFDYFTEAVNGEADVSTSFATQSEDDNVLVTGVAGDVNAISYFGYAYYVENTDKLKAVEIDGGSGCIAPTDETIGDNSYSPLSRPLFIYPNTATAKEDPALKAFVDFYLANTATLSAEVGYIAVPAAVAAEQVAAWDAATAN
jgi:phosphate transport system substrate-binding protein